jgi:hypothetical protein
MDPMNPLLTPLVLTGGETAAHREALAARVPARTENVA